MNNVTEQIFLLNPAVPQSSSVPVKIIETPAVGQVNLDNVEDFSKVCRMCAVVTELLIPIFSGEGLQNNLADKIHKHLPITVSEEDMLPRAVCYQCAHTLLAWHELAATCARADRALRATLATPACTQEAPTPTKHIAQEHQPTTSQENQIVENISQKEFKPCRYTSHTATTLDAPHKDDTQISIDHENIDPIDDPPGHDISLSDEDEPLASIAKKKTTVIYNQFYEALTNFRNHFVNEHKSRDNLPNFTDSSDSEMMLEANDNMKDEGCDVDDYDDLTQSNMRKDRMDEETRLELSQVLTKINGKVYYNCRICGKNLSSSHTYVFHKRIHTGERPCVCHVCGKQFRAPNGLQRHLTETHEKLRRHSCRYCPKNFANSQNLKQHMRIHTGERPFVCAQCGKRFTQSGSLHVHLKTHSEQFPHECAECGAKFRLRAGLVRHRLKHSGERPHVCAHCGKAFRQRHELNSHSLSHSDSKPFSCLVCGAAFRQRRALTHHTRRLHEHEHSRVATAAAAAAAREPAMLIYTNIAHSKIIEIGELNRSVCRSEDRPEDDSAITSTEASKKVECQICNRSVSIASWARHARTHIGEKRFSCHTCGLAFGDSGNLARHARALHDKQRAHACPVCGKAFSRRTHLEDHTRSHSDERQFVCETCGARCKSGAALRMHSRTHAAERRHQCVQCGGRYRRRSELRAHLTVHSGERAHACLCGRAFRLRAQLNLHIKRMQHAASEPPPMKPPPAYPAAAPASEETAAESQRCLYCGARLPPAQYRRHLLQAHADLVFHCDECDGFIDRNDLILHMSLHVAQYTTTTRNKHQPNNKHIKRKKKHDARAAPNQIVKIEHIEIEVPPAPAIPSTKTQNHSDPNEFSDHSDTEFGFGPLPESVFDAIEDSQDSQLLDNPASLLSDVPDAMELDREADHDVDANSMKEESKRDETKLEQVDRLNIVAETYIKGGVDDTRTETNTLSQPINSAKKESSEKKHKKRRQCPICGKVYTASSSYFYHMNAAHARSRPFECAVCGSKFHTKAVLRQHVGTHSAARPNECRECGKRFKSKAGLYIHAQKHTGTKKFKCGVCPVSFRWRTHLARHAARHAATRAHACPHAGCPRAFAVRADLVRHCATHRPPDETRVTCPHPHCALTFAQPRYLRAHIHNKHAGKLPASEDDSHAAQDVQSIPNKPND